MLNVLDNHNTMDNTERKILKDIADRLDSSTLTSWDRGDLEAFKIWSIKMRETINTITPIIRTISNSEIEQPIIRSISSDVNHLWFIYERLIGHGENPNVDYIIKYKEIIDSIG